MKEGQTTSDIARTLNKNLIDEGAISASFEPDIRLRRRLKEEEPYEPHLAFEKENALKLKKENAVTWEPGIGL